MILTIDSWIYESYSLLKSPINKLSSKQLTVSKLIYQLTALARKYT